MPPKFVPFYASLDQTCTLLDDAQRLKLFDAIRDFGFRGIYPSFEVVDPETGEVTIDKVLTASWLNIAPTIEQTIKKAEAGAKGGRPPKNKQ